jgi:hypothetical protein
VAKSIRAIEQRVRQQRNWGNTVVIVDSSDTRKLNRAEDQMPQVACYTTGKNKNTTVNDVVLSADGMVFRMNGKLPKDEQLIEALLGLLAIYYIFDFPFPDDQWPFLGTLAEVLFDDTCRVTKKQTNGMVHAIAFIKDVILQG